MNEHLIPIRTELQKIALANPCLTPEDLEKALKSDAFHRVFRFNNMTAISVLMTISPNDGDFELPFWHASAAFVNSISGKPKSYQLLTKKERHILKDVVRFFLKGAGDGYNLVEFVVTKSAIHGHKDLSKVEAEMVGVY